MNNNKQTKKSLIYSFMLGMGVCSRIVAFGATYTWQAVDGVWDGNISDPAHWRCDTAGSPGYPQSTSDRMDVPANAKAKITIDTDHSLGSLFCLAGSDVTLVSAVNDNGATEIELGDFKVYEIGGPLPVWAPEFERPKERR